MEPDHYAIKTSLSLDVLLKDSIVEKLGTKKLEDSSSEFFIHIIISVTLSHFLDAKPVGGTYVDKGQKPLFSSRNFQFISNHMYNPHSDDFLSLKK